MLPRFRPLYRSNLRCPNHDCGPGRTAETGGSTTASAAPKSTANKKLSAAAKAKADEQKALALSLLVSLATDARSFPDQTLRARTLARIADALWEPDPDQSRTLFRRAWDAATVADQESLRKMEEDRKKQEAATGSFAIARAQTCARRFCGWQRDVIAPWAKRCWKR